MYCVHAVKDSFRAVVTFDAEIRLKDYYFWGKIKDNKRIGNTVRSIIHPDHQISLPLIIISGEE